MTISDVIREHGPLTVAAFMELALYDPEVGYYARAAQRSGRSGDFFTSVDVGPLFGELLEIQLAEMFELLQTSDFKLQTFDLVEAGAGNGRLAADIARAARRQHPAFYESLRLHLVEASAAARAAQRSTLADVADRVASSSAALPDSFEGALIANELLDALPVHQVVMREDGLHEIYVVGSRQSSVVSRQSAVVRRQSSDGSQQSAVGSQQSAVGSRRGSNLTTVEGPPSTPALQEYLDRLHVRLEPGWRVEINLCAVDWMRDAARRLHRGFIVLIDYGHDARELYSPTHSAGTLTTYSSHRSTGPESVHGIEPWLRNPGAQDLTAHVDFTSVRNAAEAEGLTAIAFLDQTYFLLGLVESIRNPQSAPLNPQSAPLNPQSAPLNPQSNPQSAIRNPQSLKTLLMPGGLGSTHKVLILGKGVGAPALRGCSFKVRVT